jgi:exodeoxyribonuclease VII large subunit
VQGDAAAGQVAAAIRGFNAMTPGGPVPRPDILIVARGGGSVEDLWAFNDETLARTVAESAIPLISAVGHETDTTLIDFAAARRAPTPTAAAEMATPVLSELKAMLSVAGGRLDRASGNLLEGRRTRLAAAAAGLPRLSDLVELPAQRFDFIASRLAAGLSGNIAVHTQHLIASSARLTPRLLSRPVEQQGARVTDLGARLASAATRRHRLAADRADLPGLGLRLSAAMTRQLDARSEGLARLEQLRRSVNPDRPLSLGFARVHAADGSLVRSASQLAAGDPARLVFADGERHAVITDGAEPARPRKVGKPSGPAGQGSLF